jgi:hypothetical protein
VTFRRASGSGRSASPATGTRSRGASALGGCQAHVPHSQPHAAPFLPQRPRPICRRYPASTRPSVRRSARGQARAAVPPDPLRVVYGHSLTLHGSTIPFAPEREALPEDIALAYAKVLRTPVYKALPFEQRWSVWGAGYGGYNKTSGDPVVVGSHDLTARTAGGAAGIDYRITPGTVVGFALQPTSATVTTRVTPRAAPPRHTAPAAPTNSAADPWLALGDTARTAPMP